MEFPQGSARLWGWISAHCVPWQIFSQKTKGGRQDAGPGSAEPEQFFPKILSGFSSACVEVPGQVETLLGSFSSRSHSPRLFPCPWRHSYVLWPSPCPKVCLLGPTNFCSKRSSKPLLDFIFFKARGSFPTYPHIFSPSIPSSSALQAPKLPLCFSQGVLGSPGGGAAQDGLSISCCTSQLPEGPGSREGSPKGPTVPSSWIVLFPATNPYKPGHISTFCAHLNSVALFSPQALCSWMLWKGN